MQVRVQVQVTSEERASSGTGTGRWKYPPVVDRLWMGARVSKYQSTPSRRTACLGVWGRGRGVRVKREKKRMGEAGALGERRRGTKTNGQARAGTGLVVIHATRQRKTEMLR